MPDPHPAIVPLRSHRQQRAQLIQKLQHAIPGFVLLSAGLQTLTQAPRGAALALAMFEIVSSGLLLANFAREVRANRHLLHRSPHGHSEHFHHGIEWADLFAAAVILAEGFEHRMHGGHHFPRPALLTAAVLLAAGVFHGRIARFAEIRRALKITENGLAIGGRPFRERRINASWADLQSIDIGDRWAVITTRAGRVRKLDLSDLDGAEHARAALETARERLERSQELRGSGEHEIGIEIP